MKKIISNRMTAGIMVLCLAAALTGCGNTPKETAPPEPDEPAITVEEENPGDETYIDEALRGETVSPGEKKNSNENSDGVYRIRVVDEEMDPVEGAMVQFCSDIACMMAITGSDGTVTFAEPPGVYEVHVRALPEGYDENTNTYMTEDQYSEMVIIVEKK